MNCNEGITRICKCTNIWLYKVEKDTKHLSSTLHGIKDECWAHRDF